MAALEGIIAARQREKEEARLKRDQEKEMEFRSEQKEKVNILKTFFILQLLPGISIYACEYSVLKVYTVVQAI